MSNKLQRILKRDKPKADILENMTRTWFKNSDAPEAIVTIKPNTASRSVKQNAFYWRIVSIIADDTGNSPDALHTYFSSQFLEPLIEEKWHSSYYGIKEKSIRLSFKTKTNKFTTKIIYKK